MIGGQPRGRDIQRTRRHYQLAAATRSRQWTPAVTAEPFCKAFRVGKIEARDDVFSRKPFQLQWIRNEIRRVARASPASASRAVAMNQALQRSGDLERHSAAKTSSMERWVNHERLSWRKDEPFCS